MTPEGKIQSKITKHLERYGYFVIKLLRTTKNGIPDLMAIHKEYDMLFVEVKTEKGILSPLQKVRIKKLENLNKTVIIPYGYDDFIKKYEILLKKHKATKK